jgi:hypothetical protein
MKIYEDVKIERDRVQFYINKYGWTPDHNLDWFIDASTSVKSKPAFVEFDDGGLLVQNGGSEWRIWSDPLSKKESSSNKIAEFAEFVFKNGIEKVWCDDVSETIRPELLDKGLSVQPIYYSLFWPVLDMLKYDFNLPGNGFKEIRNARSKFYREHQVEAKNTSEVDKKDLHKIVDSWYSVVLKKRKEDIFQEKYHRAIDNDFAGFVTARVLAVDGRLVGINAGYEVPNLPGRFTGVIGIHDYSLNDLGVILWLEDLKWIKNAGYKELDMQGSENDGGLKLKLRFGAIIERKTNTFCIQK